MKIEVTITDEVQLRVASRVRSLLLEIVQKEIRTAKIADIISERELIQLPGWEAFIRANVQESWTEDFQDSFPDCISLFAGDVTAPFAVHIEKARESANARRAAKSKSIKLSPSDHAAAKKVLREAGISFE